MPAKYGHRSCGGPIPTLAEHLHARLYGLPFDAEPLPTALDELLQATHSDRNREQQAAVIAQLAEQMRNAAEILHWACLNSHPHRPHTWEWLRNTAHVTAQLADDLNEVSATFATPQSDTKPLASTPASAPLPTPRPTPKRH